MAKKYDGSNYKYRSSESVVNARISGDKKFIKDTAKGAGKVIAKTAGMVATGNAAMDRILKAGGKDNGFFGHYDVAKVQVVSNPAQPNGQCGKDHFMPSKSGVKGTVK